MKSYYYYIINEFDHNGADWKVAKQNERCKRTTPEIYLHSSRSKQHNLKIREVFPSNFP